MGTSGLTGRALTGLSWNYVGTLGRIAATFLSQILLARLLGPEQFGLFGYAFLTVTVLALVVEMGLQMALVQVPQLRDEDIARAFGRLLLAGAVAASMVVLFADGIAAYVFAVPQAADVIRAMAPTLVVGAVTAVATALLSRDIEFKVIQLAGLGSYVVGYLIVGVGAAMAGLGVWSLVLAWHVQTISACVVMVYFAPRVQLPGNPFRPLGIARFGSVIMVTNMINWLIDNSPHVAIGRWLGPSQLGQYTIANNLVRVPADHLVRNLQTVLFPLAARAQNNDEGVRRAYLTVLAGVALVALPTFTFIAIASQTIVLLLLGAKWAIAADVLVPLSMAMIGHAVEALCGPVLGGRGEPKLELKVKAATLLVMAAALAVTATWSLVAVGWSVASVYLFRWVWMNAAVMNRLAISSLTILRVLVGPLVLAAVCAVVAGSVIAYVASVPPLSTPLWMFLITAACAFIAVVLTVEIIPAIVLGPHLLALLNIMVARRPGIGRVPGLRRVVAIAARMAV
ncbi:MAG: lipopolysaccharide biosynthesis protein [Burkholderiaceae bacterium]|nr:lipopolysaccharide biosynthesis protein [Burkholderiaceae bacterium]